MATLSSSSGFSNTTLVALADGSMKTFLDLIAMNNNEIEVFGISLDDKANPVNKRLTSPRKIGAGSVLNIVLKDQTIFQASLNQIFYVIDQDTKSVMEVQASSLRPGMMHAQFSYHTAKPQMIASIYPQSGSQDLYTLTANDYGNFILSGGFAVKADP